MYACSRFENIDGVVLSTLSDIRAFVSAVINYDGHYSEELSRIEKAKNKVHREKDPDKKATNVQEFLDLLKIDEMKSKSSTILFSMLSTVLKNCKHPLHIYYVDNYNDRSFFDSYKYYYAAKYRHVNSFCSRFFIFDHTLLDQVVEDETFERCVNAAFIGSFVRRPIPGCEIGRTLLDPRYFFDNVFSDSDTFEDRETLDPPCNIWRNKYKMTLCGISLSVWAFPFSMQDCEMSTCSETTALNIFDYYSKRYPDYRSVYPSEISDYIREMTGLPSVPAKGLTYEMLSKLFTHFGFSPVLVQLSNTGVADVLQAYVASGVPVALGIKSLKEPHMRHSVIITGTEYKFATASSLERKLALLTAQTIRPGNGEDQNDIHILLKGALGHSYVIMDDGRPPYSIASFGSYSDKLIIRYKESFENAGRVLGNLRDKDSQIYSLLPSFPNEVTSDWEMSVFVAPMGKEMVMNAQTALYIFQSILYNKICGYSFYIKRLSQSLPEEDPSHDIGIQKNVMKALEAGFSENYPLVVRVFLCPARRYKEQRIKEYSAQGNSKDLSLLQHLHCPRFLWVAELYTPSSFVKETGPECVGEIVLDATTTTSPSDQLSNVILIKYPFFSACCTPDQTESIVEQIRDGTEDIFYKSFSGFAPFRFELH